jgi:putative flippase GtrA
LALEQGAGAVGYWDADLATPLEAIATFEHALSTTKARFILGSRIQLLGRSIERRAHRHYLGRVFATAASLALNLPVYDTQCGAKLLLVDADTRRLFERPFASRWIFDVELIARYLQLAGPEGIYEEPLIRWRDVGESKVRPVDFLRSAGEMLQIYRRYPLGQPGHRIICALTGAFSRYVVVGGLGTLVHYATLVVAVEVGHVPPAVAAVLGAALGACVNYFLNYHLTFASHASHKRAVPRFILIALLGTLFSGAGVHLGAEIGLHYIAAQLACTLVFLVLGFLLNRAFTF